MGNCFCKGEDANRDRRDSLSHSSPQSATAALAQYAPSADSMVLDDSAPPSTTTVDDAPRADDDPEAKKQRPLELVNDGDLLSSRNVHSDTAPVDDAAVGEQQKQQQRKMSHDQQTQAQEQQQHSAQQQVSPHPEDDLRNSHGIDEDGFGSLSMCSSRTMSEDSGGKRKGSSSSSSNTRTSRSSSFDLPQQLLAPAEPAASRSEQFRAAGARPAAAPGAVPAIRGIPRVSGSGGSGGGGSRSDVGSSKAGGGADGSRESLLSFIGGSSMGDSDSRESLAAPCSRSASYNASVLTPRSASSDRGDGDQRSLVDAALAASASGNIEMPHAVAARK